MNSELAKIFTPRTEEGELDYRYKSDIQLILESVRPEVLEGLAEFKHKTSDLGNRYGLQAVELCLDWFRVIDGLWSNDTDNKFNYRSKGLGKQLIKGLTLLGFKPYMVSKIIAVAEFQKLLRDGMNKGRKEGVNKGYWKMYEFVVSHPISSQYILSGTNPKGIAKAMKLEKDTMTYDSETYHYKVKTVPLRALESIKSQYPENPDETRGGRKNQLSKLEEVEDNQETITIEATEIKESTQAEIANNIVSLAKQLNTSEIWRDSEIVEILKGAEKELIALGHMVLTPSDKVLTSN